jgi:hypothetical protein
LQRILQVEDPAARVLDLGISGTNPNEYARVFQYALKLRPRAIVIGFYVGKDASQAHAPEVPPRWRSIQFLSEKIRIAKRRLNPNPFNSGLMASAYRWWICQNAGITVTEFWRRYDRMPPEIKQQLAKQSINFHLILLALLQSDIIYDNLTLGDPAASEGIRNAFAIFSSMQLECAQRGIRFYVAAIPASVQVSAHYHGLLAAMGFKNLDKSLGQSALERSARQPVFHFSLILSWIP